MGLGYVITAYALVMAFFVGYALWLRARRAALLRARERTHS